MELTTIQNALTTYDYKQLLGRSDVMAAFGLVAILMMMIIPMPPLVLDLFLTLSITVALHGSARRPSA